MALDPQLNPSFLVDPIRACGLEIPKPAQDALDALAVLREPIQSLGDLEQAAYAAVIGGEVTAANVAARVAEHAQGMLLADHTQRALTHFEKPLALRFRGAIQDAGAELIEQLREPFSSNAAIAQTYGPLVAPGATAEEILHSGQAAGWEQLQGALGALRVIRGLRIKLGELMGHIDEDATWWIAGAEDADELDRALRAFRRGDFHNLAAAGFVLRLNTTEEARGLEAAARSVTKMRTDAERARRNAEHASGYVWPEFITSSDAA